MNYTGNVDYKAIKDKQFLTADSEKVSEIVKKLNEQNIEFSARYDDTKMTVTFHKDDFDKVNEILTAAGRVESPQQPENNVNNQSAAYEAQLEELKKMILEMQQEQKSKEQKSEESRQDTDTAKEPPIIEKKPQISINEVKPEHSALLPIIGTKIVKHEQRIEELKDRRAAHEDKITDYQSKAARLTVKSERLMATNQMLAELLTRRKMPAAVVNSVRGLIRANEAQAANIRNNKLPKIESKISSRMTKIESIDKRINLRQSKINRYTSLNKVIRSFAHADRKMFSASLDEFHNNTINMLNAKIDVRTENIIRLTEFYKRSPVRAAAADVHLRLTRQKMSRQKLIQKRNKLMGVIIPYASQPEQVQDSVMKQAEEIITNAAKQENITPAEVSENVVLSAVPLLPERSIEVPDTRQEEMERLLPEIATVMDMPISQLESKPRDLRDLLILDYTNNFESTPEDIRESLTRLMDPDVRTEEMVEKHKQEKNGLVSIEHNGFIEHYILPDELSVQRTLEILANAERPFIALREIGDQVDELSAAVYEQSDICGFSVTADYDKGTAMIYKINGGMGGIGENDRTDDNVSFDHVDLNDYKVNEPHKTTEKIAENNNEPPKKQEVPKKEKTQGFSFSLAQLKQNAKRISQQQSEKPQEKGRKPPDHGSL